MMIVVAALAMVGLGIASYFTAVTYGWMRADSTLIPRLCRMERDTCAYVLETPQAKVFGLPNSALGIVYYLLVLSRCASGPWAPIWESALLASALLTVALGAYLTYSLLYRLRVTCPLCLLSHAANALIALLLIVATWPTGP